ncbi:hypothetical protein PCL_01944 [Purpureocillium lilacinum]|uniref:Arthropod defensin domain-containing protein n=1 Tax=Purpureocillium lilacinum TaxID=33203 RepID=A0A2U3E0Y6_PURLI|nr:hypothetical protein PCL_01944 [Purpureocillium lilacinum]GJN69385.1 hypothetical protein PLICBS_003433 [Purpureocillium lilacinum]
MKFAAYISVLSTLLMAACAEVTWYDANRNVTCAGHDDGHIQCEEGHLNEAEALKLEAQTSPAIKGRAASPLQKRVTCNIDGVTKGLACFGHCYAIGYCNSHCDEKNICRCDCKDLVEFPNPFVCSKTTCS